LRVFFNYIVSCIFLVGPFSLAHGQGLPEEMVQLDSIEIPTTAIDQKMEELDSLVDRYSLNKGEVVTDSMDNLIEKAVNAVASQIDSLQRIIEKPLEHPKKVVNRADSLLNGITSKVKKLQDKLGSETGLKSSPGQDTNLNSLFDQCDIIKQQNLLKGLPSLNELKSANFQKSIRGLGISDDISSKLPDGINDNINQLAGTGNLNSYLNDQLRQMGVPGTDDWKKAAKDPEYLDKILDQKASQFTEAQLLKKETGELNQVKTMADNLLREAPKPSDANDLTNNGKKLAIKNATDYMEGHEDKLQTAQNQLTKLKKKYSFIGSTSDMKNAKKAKSLEGQPLKKRLVFGGNFNLQRGNPTSLDLSPMIMYKLDKKTYLGVSGTYRVKLGVEDKFQTNVVQDVYGYSAVGEYQIKNGFFGYVEFEYLSSPDLSPTNTDDKLRKWQEGLLIGIGKQFNFTKGLRARIIFTYNTLYDQENTPANSPWNFKFGIHTKQLSLKGISF
jgi:hypothetical protein